MSQAIIVKEAPVEVAVEVNSKVTEFGEKYGKEHFQERYSGKKKLILAAYVSGVPAGYLIGYENSKKEFYCWMAGVDPTYRRRGILTAMMDSMEAWAKDNGYSLISVKTRNNKRSMLAYLVKSGYNFTSVEPFPDQTENRIMLEKRLSG